nr:biotin/lipoyl-binding protein [Photobacterium phosphoreum]
MKEKIYQYTIYIGLTIVSCFSLFLLISDNVAPFTTQSTLYRAVANISPQVSGVITNVAIQNGQTIHQGELLFTIDPMPYALCAKSSSSTSRFNPSRSKLFSANSTISHS